MSEKTETENHPPRILLIDDDEEFTDDLIFLLDGPYQIVAVNESRKGIGFLGKAKFDLVILDLLMPAFYADQDEKEGIEMLKIIRQNWSMDILPVIIITKMDTLENRTICQKLQANEFVTKPLNILLLNKKIEQLMRKGTKNGKN